MKKYEDEHVAVQNLIHLSFIIENV